MRKVYCDANIFIGWFNNEEDKVEACRGLVDASEQGEVRIITSALTLTEVIKIKGQQPLPQSKEETIKDFFEQEFIGIVNVDRRTAEFARDLIWRYPHLNPKDSIHVATALLTEGIDVLHTFDDDLLRLDGQLEDPPLRISTPDIPDQLPIPFA
ncbi:MAG: PIN domain-containing protein [Gemmatimonadetes bacterium]|nr:PIN domain-containing protein [Gemmatimonadota bacterium]